MPAITSLTAADLFISHRFSIPCQCWLSCVCVHHGFFDALNRVLREFPEGGCLANTETCVEIFDHTRIGLQ